MKRIALSLVTIVAVVAMVTGASQAVFSDTDSVLGNTVSTANLSIDARVVINKPLEDIKMLPGNWGNPGTVDLYNDGDVAHRQWMHVEDITGPLCDYVELKVGYSWTGPNLFDVTFGTFPLSNLLGTGKAMLVGRSDPIAANITTRLVQQAYLRVDTPDELQSSTCTWNEVFTATQPGYGI